MLAVLPVSGWHAAGLPLLLLAGIDVALAWRLARSDRQWLAEILALLGAQAVALWLVAPYFTSSHIGAGDSFWYSLVIADFIEQLHRGVFPVFVGQSFYNFNGNIHFFRDAPYFVYLAGALDLLTAERLSAFALQNLCLIVSVLGGATTSYVAVRVLAPAWRWAAPLLAALYVLCPAVMVLLAGMDMQPAIMTLPWLPLFWLGVAGSLLPGDDTRSLIISTAALALIWYAHPAIGAWVMPFWLGAFCLRLFLLERTLRCAVRLLLAGVALGWLISYLFVSVSSMELHYALKHEKVAQAIFDSLREGWTGCWLPLSEPVGKLGNIQLGYSLAAIALGCLFLQRRNQLAGWCLGAAILALLLLLVPVPGAAQYVWSLVPKKLIDASNVWPMQRFYLIIPASIPVWAALTLRGWTPTPRLRHVGLVLLTVGVAWSAWQEELPRNLARLVTRTPAVSAALLQPVNLALTRGPYLFFKIQPSYFSHGVMEPAFETRLLDQAMQPLLDNASALYRLKSAGPPIAVLEPRRIATINPEVKRREATFETDGHSQYLLAFSFTGTPNGDIELFGAGGLSRHYDLPLSGGSRAFGAGASPFVPLGLPPGPAGSITLRTEVSGLSARVYAFRPEELPIKTDSMIPLAIHLDAPQAGWIETPRVFIPGYVATVNGAPVTVVPSREKLAAVPVPAGPVSVVLTYVGTSALRLAFWFSLSGFIFLPAVGILLWRRAAGRIVLPSSA